MSKSFRRYSDYSDMHKICDEDLEDIVRLNMNPTMRISIESIARNNNTTFSKAVQMLIMHSFHDKALDKQMLSPPLKDDVWKFFPED